MNVKIVNTVFNLNILRKSYLDKYFKAYETDEEAMVDIEYKQVDSFIIPKSRPSFSSKSFDLYEDDTLVQIEHALANGDGDAARIDYTKSKCLVAIRDTSVEMELVLLQYIIAYYVCLQNKAIFMHSSCFCYKDNGYLLSAKSGAGKSTHARLWQEYYGVEIINDDKNFVVLEDNHLYIYGNPLSGKHHKDINKKVLLKAVIFLSQAKTNEIKELDETSKIVSLLGQISRPNALFNKDDWNMVFNKLNALPFYHLDCTISKEAVDTLKEVIDHEIK